MIRNASDLTPTERAALETLLGRHVRDGESVSLRTFEQANVPAQQRVEVVNELKKYFAEIDSARKPATEAEQEQAITEAMRSVRPGYRSHQ